MARYFVGFSTEKRFPDNTTLYDIDLVKQDLRNYFHTRRGERVMLPEYGTIIWDLIFEPFTDSIREDIEEDVMQGISLEPRVELQNMVVDEYEYGIMVATNLIFRPQEVVETLNLTFDRRLAERGL